MKVQFQAGVLALVISFVISYEVRSNDITLNKADKKRFECIANYVNHNSKKREKQIVHRACEKLISKNDML